MLNVYFTRGAVLLLLSIWAASGQERRLREGSTTSESYWQRSVRDDLLVSSSGVLIELSDKPSRQESAAGAQVADAQARVSRWIESHGGRIRHRFRLLGLMAADIPPEVRDELLALPDVAAVSSDAAVEFQIDRSVPAMAVERIWSEGFLGSGESVILFDTGVNANHAALRGRVESGVYLEGQNCPPDELASGLDFDGHGTHMAGILASAGTPAQPAFRGVAPELARVINAKVGCQGGPVLSSALLAAIEAALIATPSPIAVSAATAAATGDDDVLSRAIDSLIDRFNLIWINAAGNGGPGEFTVASPATAYNAISVANLDLRGTSERQNAEVFESSSRGPTRAGRFKPDVAAPGTGIFSAGITGDEFVSRTGTSMAAAHVAGMAALLRQAGVRDRLAMKALLINTTDRDGWDAGDGWGFVSADRAFGQRQHGLTGTIAPANGASAYYRVIVPPGGSYFATLVWNRTFAGSQSVLRNLDLSVYRADNGAEVRRSLFLNQNVEQVAFRNTGPSAAAYILRVESRSGGTGPEPFALASSLPLEVFAAPSLDVNCIFPGPVEPVRAIEVPCTARNLGALPYFNVTFTALSGDSTVGSAGVGALPANESKTATIRWTAPPAPGTYPIAIRSIGASFGPTDTVTVNGSITVNPPGGITTPLISGVVNGASFAGAFTSGSWITIAGVQLSPTTRTWRDSDFVGGKLPVELDGVRVLVNGRPAYPAYISPGQINALAPDDDTEGEVEIIVVNTLGESPPVKATKLPLAPALFTYSAGGDLYVAATAADGTLIGPSGALPGVTTRPARPGERILLYGTGCGLTSPPVPSDSVVTVGVPLARTPEIQFGEDQAQVEFAGLVAPGLCQFNVVVPDPMTETGDVSLTLTFGEVGALNEPLIAIEEPE